MSDKNPITMAELEAAELRRRLDPGLGGSAEPVASPSLLESARILIAAARHGHIDFAWHQAAASVEMSLREALARAPQGDAAPGLNLSAVNLARCTAPDGFNHPLASWSVAEWTNAVAGEAGEACNLAKKLIRHRDGVPGNKKPEDKDQDSLRRRIAEELADVVIYCDLAMASVGYDFATVIRDVFNRKSQELGSPYVLSGGASSSGSAPEGPSVPTPTNSAPASSSLVIAGSCPPAPSPTDAQIDAFVYTLTGIPEAPPSVDDLKSRRRLVREFLWRLDRESPMGSR